MSRSVTRWPCGAIQPTMRDSAVYSSIGASSGAAAVATAVLPSVAAAPGPRRQFQNVNVPSCSNGGAWALRDPAAHATRLAGRDQRADSPSGGPLHPSTARTLRYAAGMIEFDDFARVEMRVGTILAAEPFPEARKPAYRLRIDFGPEVGSGTAPRS